MEKKTIKKLLKDIKNNNYAVPDGINPYDLSIEMMNYIGNTDSELRDDLILSILSKWIINDTLLINIIYMLLMIALDENHLLNGLGKINDTVFIRTFSAEIIAIIIYKHRQENFLSEIDIKKVFNSILKFYNEDKDVRGFVDGKGWAHGAAHGADALYQLANCQELGYEELKMILHSIYKKVNVNYYGYIHFEDERMVTTVKAILERNIIPVNEIVDWINSFKEIDDIDTLAEKLVVNFNVNTFLKSLYFRFIYIKEYKLITDTTKDVLKKISLFEQ